MKSFIDRLFRTEGKFPVRPGMETVKAYRAQRAKDLNSVGILMSNGEPWWKIRSKAQHTFLKPKNVEHYAPVLSEIADDFIKRSDQRIFSSFSSLNVTLKHLTNRIRLIRPGNNEMKPNFHNEMYRWALECKYTKIASNMYMLCTQRKIRGDCDLLTFIFMAIVCLISCQLWAWSDSILDWAV